MFDQIVLYLVLICSGLSIWLLVAIPWVLSQTESDNQLSGNWQDRSTGFLRLIRPLLRVYSGNVEQSLSEVTANRIHKKLLIAGLGYTLTAAEFTVLKRIAGIICMILCGIVVWLAGLSNTLQILILIIVISAVGFYYPDIRIRDLTKYRQLSIEKHFPFFLDLVVLSMRAGLPFTGAVQQGIEKMVVGPLKDELMRYQREIRTGVERREALERLAARIDLSSVTNFVASIIQAEESGGSVTSVLQDQARQRRKERFLRAEKLANEAPVKMLLPLVGLLFPLTFMIIGVPIVVQFMESGLFGKVF